jgi:hypothetical protein
VANRFDPALGNSFVSFLAPYLKGINKTDAEETGWSATDDSWVAEKAEVSPKLKTPLGFNGTKLAFDRRKRGVPSPDEADAVCLTYAEPSGFRVNKNLNKDLRELYAKQGLYA